MMYWIGSMRVEDYSPFNPVTCMRDGCGRLARRRIYVPAATPFRSELVFSVCEKCAAKVILLPHDKVLTFLETKEEKRP